MSESTARHGWPLIAPGQAQKEMSHNEALAAIDLVAQAHVEAVGIETPPPAPVEGQCWIVGPAPTGAWTGHGGALAGWTAGGWRFAAPRPGMTVTTAGPAGFARFGADGWSSGVLTGLAVSLAGQQVVGARRPAIADASGGGTVDAEARAAVNAVLTALRAHGLIGS